jgi:hypothetical protein
MDDDEHGGDEDEDEDEDEETSSVDAASSVKY